MTATRKGAPSARWIPWSFVGFFLVVFLANGIMLYFALDSWTGVATEDAFKKGLAYNDRLAEAEAQARLGWQIDLTVPDRVGERNNLGLSLMDDSGRAIEGAVVQARLVRPTHEGFDRELSLTEQGQGRYIGAVNVSLPGLWEVQLQIARQGDIFRHSERFEAQP